MKQQLKRDIHAFLRERGADLIGIASADAWNHDGRVSEAYRPGSLWPLTRSVIVMGIQMPLPIVETTPSVHHRDLYTTCNRVLDGLAFDLSRWLNRRGHPSIPLSRDGYATINILIDNPRVAFAHNHAAYYAGLGHIGINNTILTEEFGPRVRFVSVFTAADLPTGRPIENLCIRCGACVEFCPVSALKMSKRELRDRNVIVADYDRHACALWARAMTERGCYPCGICIKVCPVGKDRIVYGREKMRSHYRKELSSPIMDAPDPLHRSWNHLRCHGSRLIGNDVPSDTTVGDIFQTIRKEILGREP